MGWLRNLWHNLGPWEGDDMDQQPPIVIIVTHAPRAIGHIEADLVIQGVMTARDRARGTWTRKDQSPPKLDALLDEYMAARDRASLESL